MENKELQEEYIRVKEKLDKLQYLYWDVDWKLIKKGNKEELETEIKDTFTLLKSLNKQMYYEE